MVQKELKGGVSQEMTASVIFEAGYKETGTLSEQASDEVEGDLLDLPRMAGYDQSHSKTVAEMMRHHSPDI